MVCSGFFYLGGDAVVMRYLPALAPGQQRRFLLRYGSLVAAAWLPWLGVAWRWPQLLPALCGPHFAGRIAWRLVLLSPLCIAYSLTTAVLKARLEMRAAQILKRVVPLGSCLLYAGMAEMARGWLRAHLVLGLWGVYAVLAAVAAIVGAVCGWRSLPRTARTGTAWPPGIWPYLGSVQANSILSFLANRADMLLVLAAGGLKILGEYVVLKTLAQGLRSWVKLLLDSFFPALSYALGESNVRAARQIARTYLRLIYPATLAAATLVLFCGSALLAGLGPAYAGLLPYVPWVMACAAIQALNTVHGSLIAACGAPQKILPATLTRVGILLGSFWPLWQRAGLAGAVMAWAAAEGVYHLWSLRLIRNLPIFDASYFETYRAYVMSLTAALLFMVLYPRIPWPGGLALWMLNAGIFLRLGRYQSQELRRLGRQIWPRRWLFVQA
jgi:O-antigen/teichoic acid export membrane protein